MRYFFIFVVFLESLWYLKADTSVPNYYKDVIQDKNYTRELSAGYFTGQLTVLEIAVPLQVLVAIKEDEQRASWIIKVRMTWNDFRLAFDPEVYRFPSIYLPSSVIYVPPLTMFNSITYEFMDQEAQSNIAEISADGTVRLTSKIYAETVCQCDVSDFPFDTQVCTLDFETNNVPNYVSYLMMEPLTNDSDMGLRVGTPEWTYVNQSFSYSWYGTSKKNFSILFVESTLKRNSQFYILVLVLPTGAITMCSLAALLLPLDMDGGEKIEVALASFLGLLFMMSIFIQQIPKSTVFPLLGKWVIFQLLLVFLGLCVGPILQFIMMIVRRRRKKGEPRSFITRSLLDTVAFLLFTMANLILTLIMMCRKYGYIQPIEPRTL